jgi:hypothetical protein
MPKTDADKWRLLQATALINVERRGELHMLSMPISVDDVARHVSKPERGD